MSAFGVRFAIGPASPSAVRMSRSAWSASRSAGDSAFASASARSHSAVSRARPSCAFCSRSS